MIYGGDKAIEMPVKDLYDTSLMIASINAAKDIYDKNEKRMDDFAKTYGDFYSPISKDVDYWYNNTTGKLNKVVDYLYKNGYDPYRSAEARSIIARTVREAPVEELAKIKQTSENAKAYQKAYAALLAAGKLDPKAEQWFIELQYGPGTTFAGWDTAKDGVWTRLSPDEYQSIHDLVDPYTKDITPQFDKEMSKNGWDYYTISPGRVNDAVAMGIPSIMSTPYGSYYYNQVYNANGGDKKAADEAFKKLLVQGSGKLSPDGTAGIYKKEADEYYKMDKQFDHDVALEKMKEKFEASENEKNRQAELQKAQAKASSALQDYDIFSRLDERANSGLGSKDSFSKADDNHIFILHGTQQTYMTNGEDDEGNPKYVKAEPGTYVVDSTAAAYSDKDIDKRKCVGKAVGSEQTITLTGEAKVRQDHNGNRRYFFRARYGGGYAWFEGTRSTSSSSHTTKNKEPEDNLDK